jgi:hypothetical protein
MTAVSSIVPQYTAGYQAGRYTPARLPAVTQAEAPAEPVRPIDRILPLDRFSGRNRTDAKERFDQDAPGNRERVDSEAPSRRTASTALSVPAGVRAAQGSTWHSPFIAQVLSQSANGDATVATEAPDTPEPWEARDVVDAYRATIARSQVIFGLASVRELNA